jgi:hypothetical protein
MNLGDMLLNLVRLRRNLVVFQENEENANKYWQTVEIMINGEHDGK